MHYGKNIQFGLRQKYAFIKNSTIFTQSFRNLVKMWIVNCGFYKKHIFFSVWILLGHTIYKRSSIKPRYFKIEPLICPKELKCGISLELKKGLQPINHHFCPVIPPRREFVKYLPKIGTQRIWQPHAKIPFNLP